MKALWKLFSSDERIERALAKTTVSRELSPPVVIVAANDEYCGPVDINGKPKSRLWIEDWSEKDQARLNDNTLVWDSIHFD
jgi:hypothetical protein